MNNPTSILRHLFPWNMEPTSPKTSSYFFIMKYILHVSPTHLSLCLVMIGLPSTLDNNLSFLSWNPHPYSSIHGISQTFYLNSISFYKSTHCHWRSFHNHWMIVQKNLHQNSFLIIVHGVFFSFLTKPFYLFAKFLLLNKTFIYFWLNLYPSTKHMSFHGKLLLLGKPLYFLC